MTSEPSTSTNLLDSERTILLQQALSQAGVIRVQKQKANSSQIQFKIRKLSETNEKITSHPLMPIVELLFTKCENSASTMNKTYFDMTDVVKLFQELEERGVECKTNNEEVDDLMQTAILALRTCLVELERVHKLSNSFKTRYLSTLKKSVCHETLVGSGGDSDDELSDPTSSSADEGRFGATGETTVATLQTASGPISIPLHITQQSITRIPSAAQIEQNMEFLKKLGYPDSIAKKISEGNTTQVSECSPDKSEEEKQLLNSGKE